MPLKINVGVSRKVGEPHYSSRGGNVHFEAEVEATLLQEPEELHKRVRYLFRLANDALQEQLGGASLPEHLTNGNNQEDPPPMSSRQRELIQRLALELNLDLEALVAEAFDTDSWQHLARTEASHLIDILKTNRAAEVRVPNGHD